MMRLNRFFTDNGVMSRRAADTAIKLGRVSVNGTTAVLGTKVTETDKIKLDGKMIRVGKKTPVIIAYHKPIGIECTSNPDVPDNIIDAVGYHERVFHIGRLDKMSEGLILLTNIGEIVNKILRARNFHEKEYIVETDGYISDEKLAAMARGIELEDGKTRPCKVERLAKRRFRMVLTEGRNRQIRRMVEAVDLGVSRLKRVRVMNIELGKLMKNDYRIINKKEKADLMEMLNRVTE
jgi:23S rRNA pseudouridine2604 synthase